MPRKPTSAHDFSTRELDPPIHLRKMKRGPALNLKQVSERKHTVLYKLPRLDSDDTLAAAQSLVNGHYWQYLGSVDDLIDWLQFEPAVLTLNWYESFNHPKKHPFIKARRQFFFIGEENVPGEVLGSCSLVACGYHKSRPGDEWIRLQHSWGHDYPLVWMPRSCVVWLWASGQMEASIAA